LLPASRLASVLSGIGLRPVLVSQLHTPGPATSSPFGERARAGEELAQSHSIPLVGAREKRDRHVEPTLNILLSFAQFEREVIGERIRDKFAASRRKGMWMGGYVPLGYDLKDRIISKAEAATVRTIFQRFARIGSVTKLSLPPIRFSMIGALNSSGCDIALANEADTLSECNATWRLS